MTTLIRIGSKIFNPRAIILCEPVTIWLHDIPGDDGLPVEALQIHLEGGHDLIITPEEWQGVKRFLDIHVAVPGELPPRPVDQSAAGDFKDERL
jgi:hypothetical protein